jgi:hypothetical protein
MEPFDDPELSALLREWKAPAAPPTLGARVLPARQSSRQTLWRWMLTGTVRIPVPAAAALLVLLALALYASRPAQPPATEPPVARQQPSTSLADFRPVETVELRVVGELK